MKDITNQLPRHPVLRYHMRDIRGIDGLSLHHSADEGDPWGWARYQIKPADQGGPPWTPDIDGDGYGDGAPGICYHYAVMRDGAIYKTQPNSIQCWHTADHNHHLIGICCQGNFTRLPPTEAQFVALLRLVSLLRAGYNKITVANIRGHVDWQGGGTSCPGTWLAAAVRGALGAN